MKLLVYVLSFLNGAYMLLDGIYVLLNGKYIGPQKPGPWAAIFYKLNVNVFKLAPLFIVLAFLWLLFIMALYSHQEWAFILGLITSIFTLWYLPFGTVFSLIVLLVLVFKRDSIGI
jgi:hypothetical protein